MTAFFNRCRAAWKRVLLWIYVLIGRCWLPVFVLGAELYALGYLPQAREVLFGLFEPFVYSRSPDFQAPSQKLPLLLFSVVGVVLALAVWYAARLLCTIDKRHVIGPRMATEQERRAQVRAVIWVPRWLGTVSLVVCVATLLTAGISPGGHSKFSPIIFSICPLAIAMFAQVLDARARRIGIWVFPIPVGCILLLEVWLEWSGVEITGAELGVVALLLCLLPAAFHLFLIRRRDILRAMFRSTPVSAPEAPRELGDVQGVVGALGATSVGLIFVLAWWPHTIEATPDIIPLFLSACLMTGLLGSMYFSRLVRWTPGIGWSALLALALVLMLAREPLGSERLRVASPSGTIIVTGHSATHDRDILVNSHGGGLRAAYFTASVMTRLDEFSCGQFGERLKTLSGASGGSLGVATYLMLHQRHELKHAWNGCVPGRFQKTVAASQAQVDAVLLDDFLSPVLANLLSTDLLPAVSPHRGQALLDGWQRAWVNAMGREGTNFASPLPDLAGVSRKSNEVERPLTLRDGPVVLLNATVVETGQRFTFSTDGGDVCGEIPSIGEAVLHSARFPLVSPPGACTTAAGQIELVDGGYNDNSGAAALAERGGIPQGAIWLDVDGNPPDGECADTAENREWSAPSTLFAARRAHALEAESMMRREVLRAGGKAVEVTFSLDKTFASTIPNVKDRCSFVRKMRSAPLGWYIARGTAWDMQSSILDAAVGVCNKMPGLCG